MIKLYANKSQVLREFLELKKNVITNIDGDIYSNPVLSGLTPLHQLRESGGSSGISSNTGTAQGKIGIQSSQGLSTDDNFSRTGSSDHSDNNDSNNSNNMLDLQHHTQSINNHFITKQRERVPQTQEVTAQHIGKSDTLRISSETLKAMQAQAAQAASSGSGNANQGVGASSSYSSKIPSQSQDTTGGAGGASNGPSGNSSSSGGIWSRLGLGKIGGIQGQGQGDIDTDNIQGGNSGSSSSNSSKSSSSSSNSNSNSKGSKGSSSDSKLDAASQVLYAQANVPTRADAVNGCGGGGEKEKARAIGSRTQSQEIAENDSNASEWDRINKQREIRDRENQLAQERKERDEALQWQEINQQRELMASRRVEYAQERQQLQQSQSVNTSILPAAAVSSERESPANTERERRGGTSASANASNVYNASHAVERERSPADKQQRGSASGSGSAGASNAVERERTPADKQRRGSASASTSGSGIAGASNVSNAVERDRDRDRESPAGQQRRGSAVMDTMTQRLSQLVAEDTNRTPSTSSSGATAPTVIATQATQAAIRVPSPSPSPSPSTSTSTSNSPLPISTNTNTNTNNAKGMSLEEAQSMMYRRLQKSAAAVVDYESDYDTEESDL